MTQTLPAITIFSLGGTIASVSTSSTVGVTPKLTAADLAGAIPELTNLAAITPVAVVQKSSSDLDWSDIARLAAAITADTTADGIVITQGTDTIEETAFALDLLLAPGRPVVITGAMRNPTLPGADGPANMLAAVRVAASQAARNLGTVVVLGDEVHAARFVHKSHTTSPATFTSPTTGRIGWVTEDRVHIALRPAQTLPTIEIPAAAASITSPAPMMPVALLRMTLGTDAALLTAIDTAHFGGLVVEGFGGGHVPGVLAAPLGAIAAIIPVVLASRTGSGAVLQRTYGTPGDEIDLLQRGLIPAGYLDGIKARIALTLLLAKGADRAEVTAFFRRCNGQ